MNRAVLHTQKSLVSCLTIAFTLPSCPTVLFQHRRRSRYVRVALVCSENEYTTAPTGPILLIAYSLRLPAKFPQPLLDLDISPLESSD